MRQLRLRERDARTLLSGRTILATVGGETLEITIGENVDWVRVVRAMLALIPPRPLDPPEAREFLTPKRKE